MRRAEGRHFELVGWFDRQTLKKPNAPWFRSFTERMFDEDYGALTGEGKLLLSYIEMHAALVHRSIFPADPRWLFRQMPILDDLPRIETLEELARPRARSGLDVGWIRFCDPSGGPWPPPLPEIESPTPVENSEGAPTEKSREEIEQRIAEQSRAEKTAPGACARAKAAQRPIGGESREEGQESTEQVPEEAPGGRTEPAEAPQVPRVVTCDRPLPLPADLPDLPLGAEVPGGKGGIDAFRWQSGGRGPPATRMMGQCLPDCLRSVQDPLRDAWAEEVYRRLRLPWPADSARGKRDLGAFRGLYDRMIVERVPETVRVLVLDHDLAWAEKHGRGGGIRNRGAMFCEVHKKRLAHFLSITGPLAVE
jgi:hypothetical protein